MSPAARLRWRLVGTVIALLLIIAAGNLLAQAVPELTELAGKLPGTVLLILAIGTLATAFTHGIAKVIQMARPPVERREVNRAVMDALAHQTKMIDSYGETVQEVAALLPRVTDLIAQQLRATEKQGEMLATVSAIAATCARSVEEHRSWVRDWNDNLRRDLQRIEDGVKDLPAAVRVAIGQRLTEDGGR